MPVTGVSGTVADGMPQRSIADMLRDDDCGCGSDGFGRGSQGLLAVDNSSRVAAGNGARMEAVQHL